MKKKFAAILAATVFTVLGIAPVVAAEYLTADELKAVLANKTAKGEHLKRDFEFNSFFAPDGGLIQVKANGYKKTGKWSIKENGKHCVEWDGTDIVKCFPVKANEDGSYTKVKIKNNGKIKKLIRWSNFREGNKI